MAQKKNRVKKGSSQRIVEADSLFILKIFIYLILGVSWLKLSHGATLQLPLPLGFLIGLVLTTHEHFAIDRKIEYAVLLVALLIGYMAPFGLYLNI